MSSISPLMLTVIAGLCNDNHNTKKQAELECKVEKEHDYQYPGALNVLDLPFDVDSGLLVWCIDAVPDTQSVPALCHHHITAGNPLHIATVGQQGDTLLVAYVVQVQLPPFISEQQVRSPGIELLHKTEKENDMQCVQYLHWV